MLVLVRVLQRNKTKRVCVCVCTHVCVHACVCIHVKCERQLKRARERDFKEVIHVIMKVQNQNL